MTSSMEKMASERAIRATVVRRCSDVGRLARALPGMEMEVVQSRPPGRGVNRGASLAAPLREPEWAVLRFCLAVKQLG